MKVRYPFTMPVPMQIFEKAEDKLQSAFLRHNCRLSSWQGRHFTPVGWPLGRHLHCDAASVEEAASTTPSCACPASQEVPPAAPPGTTSMAEGTVKPTLEGKMSLGENQFWGLIVSSLSLKFLREGRHVQWSTELRFQHYECQICRTNTRGGFRFIKTLISETKFRLGLEKSETEF